MNTGLGGLQPLVQPGPALQTEAAEQTACSLQSPLKADYSSQDCS